MLLAKLLKQRPTLHVSRRSEKSELLRRRNVRLRLKVRPVMIFVSCCKSHALYAFAAKAAEVEAKKATAAGKRT